MAKLARIIFSRPAYARVLGALFVSGIGSAFTSVAVYRELGARGAGDFTFALAFAAALLPGFFTSFGASRISRVFRLRGLLLICLGGGLIGLLLPLLGYLEGNLVCLLGAEVLASASGGLLLPVFKGLERASFAEDDFQTLAALDSWIFTGNFIFGQGLGALLAARLSFEAFLLTDAFAYVVAILLVYPLNHGLSLPLPADDEALPELRGERRRAVLLLPWLALTCAPPMILLPARAGEWSAAEFAGVQLAPVLLLICARTLGQLLGPLLALRFDLARIGERSWALPLFLVSYLALYVGAYLASSLALVAGLVLLAHVSSNFLYAVGNFRLLQVFSAAETVEVAGFTYRGVTLISALSGLGVGAVAQAYGTSVVLGFSFLALVGGAWILGGGFSPQEVVRE